MRLPTPDPDDRDLIVSLAIYVSALIVVVAFLWLWAAGGTARAEGFGNGERVDSEIIVLVDSSASVNDHELQQFRQSVFDVMSDQGIIRIVQGNGRASVHLSVYEHADPGEISMTAASTIRSMADLKAMREPLSHPGRSHRGGTATIHAINYVLAISDINGVEAHQTVVVLITDGLPAEIDPITSNAAMPPGSRETALADYAEWFEPVGLIERHRPISVIVLYRTASPHSPTVETKLAQFVRHVARGEKGRAVEYSTVALSEALRDAARIATQ